MPYILDAVILLILIVSVVRGVKKGFIKAAFSILSFLLAAALAFMFYVPFSEYVINTGLGQSVSQNLGDSIYKAVSGDGQKADTSDTENKQTQNSAKENDTASSNSLGSTTEDIIKTMNIPDFMFKSVFERSDFLMRTARLNAAQAVSSALTSAFMKLVSGVLLFLLILLGIWILRKILELVFKLPLLKEVNKLAGFIAGLVNGILISYLIIAICVSLSGFNELSFIKNTTQQSYIYKNFYQTNIIAEMFVK